MRSAKNVGDDYPLRYAIEYRSTSHSGHDTGLRSCLYLFLKSVLVRRCHFGLPTADEATSLAVWNSWGWQLGLVAGTNNR
jgi:hypothetical protein